MIRNMFADECRDEEVAVVVAFATLDDERNLRCGGCGGQVVRQQLILLQELILFALINEELQRWSVVARDELR